MPVYDKLWVSCPRTSGNDLSGRVLYVNTAAPSTYNIPKTSVTPISYAFNGLRVDDIVQVMACPRLQLSVSICPQSYGELQERGMLLGNGNCLKGGNVQILASAPAREVWFDNIGVKIVGSPVGHHRMCLDGLASLSPRLWLTQRPCV